MSKKTKLWLCLAFIFIVLGAGIFGGAMFKLKWDFTKLSTVKYENKTYQISQDYKNVSIVSNTSYVVLDVSENEQTIVNCYEQKNLTYSVQVVEDTLKIEIVDSRKWFEHIGFDFYNTKITVYLPKTEYEKLSIKSDTGNVSIPKEFKFESINVSVTTGVVYNYASTSGSTKIKTTTGNIVMKNTNSGEIDLQVSTGRITLSSVQCENSIKIRVSTGETFVTDVRCDNFSSNGSTGDIVMKDLLVNKKLSLKRSTGDVKFEKCDANELFVETDTGDVKGSLLTEKVFIARTDTGRIDVPKTISGGRCEITTDTGDIKITVSN